MRLLRALGGRPVYPGQTERENILKKGRELREKIKAFRLNYRIEDPPEHAAGIIEEVS